MEDSSLDTITGIPAHPLIVHFSLVAIPLAAILVLLFVVKPSWRDMLSYFMVAMGGAIGIGVVLAASSGESLEERVDESSLLDTHAELGDQLQIIGVIFGISLIVLGVYHLLTSRNIIQFGAERSRQLLIGFMVIALVTSGIAVTWDVRTGHSGAKSVWSELEGEGNSDGEGGDDDGHLIVDVLAYSVARPGAFVAA